MATTTAAAASSTAGSDFPVKFIRLSDQIYHLPAPTDAAASSEISPDTIILFGWGDGTPRHVSKYVDGYRALYPSASMVVILATTLKAAYQPLAERTQGMMPVIDAAFPSGGSDADAEAHSKRKVLIQCMSNAGGVNLASTLNAYKTRFGSQNALPHNLLVLDSTPGGVVFSEQVWRWSRAMAIGTANKLPWPFAVTQALWYAFLWMNKLWEFILRRKHAGAWSREFVNRPDMYPVVPQGQRRLYLYSKEDDIIGWEDIEIHVAEARQLGHKLDVEVFSGSPHVGHMRKYPEQYWATIKKAWEVAENAKAE